jgi:hypothetical protein
MNTQNPASEKAIRDDHGNPNQGRQPSVHMEWYIHIRHKRDKCASFPIVTPNRRLPVIVAVRPLDMKKGEVGRRPRLMWARAACDVSAVCEYECEKKSGEWDGTWFDRRSRPVKSAEFGGAFRGDYTVWNHARETFSHCRWTITSWATFSRLANPRKNQPHSTPQLFDQLSREPACWYCGAGMKFNNAPPIRPCNFDSG